MTSFDEFITNKELLLKDLCSRILYKIKCQVYDDPIPYTLSGIIPSRTYQELYFEEMDYKECNGFIDIKYSKPYLFPLYSMTKKQKEEFDALYWEAREKASDYSFDLVYSSIKSNWLYKNHFDVNGLIPLGLAKDATGLNIY